MIPSIKDLFTANNITDADNLLAPIFIRYGQIIVDECANRAETKTETYGSLNSENWTRTVDKYSILEIKNELK